MRDLAEWLVRMVEQRNRGVYNAAGPARPTVLTVSGCGAADRWEALRTSVDESVNFCFKMACSPGLNCLYGTPAPLLGIQEVNGNKARNFGLITRALEGTVGDTLRWIAAETHHHESLSIA